MALSSPGVRYPRQGRFSLAWPWLAVLCLAWVVPGLFGHEPWKPDEGYTVGLVKHMYDTGDWVVPTLAGEPFMEKPPLFFITAALFAKALTPRILELPQAMALATAFYILLMLFFTSLAAREAKGRGAGSIAVVCLLGCVGLAVRAHSSITDCALWCGFAMACYGVFVAPGRFWTGSFWLGTGVGLAFMSKGYMGPGFIGCACALLFLLHRGSRCFRFVKVCLWALVFSLPWLLIWPWALYARSPELFYEWFWLNNIGRLLGPAFGFPLLAQTGKPWFYLRMFFWFTLPLWPAAAVVWQRRKADGFSDAAVLFATLLVVVTVAILSFAASARELYLIPALVPLALLAVVEAETLPAWLNWALSRIPLVIFSLGLLLLWLMWLGWATGFPQTLAVRIEHFAPRLNEHTGVFSLLIAAVYTAAYVCLFRRGSRRRKNWPLVWAVGMTCFWGVATLLFMPILDYTNGYKATFKELAAVFPAGTEVVDSHTLGESQRALLDYYAGIKTNRIDSGVAQTKTGYLLVQGLEGRQYFPDENLWREIWRGSRPGDYREYFVVYRKQQE